MYRIFVCTLFLALCPLFLVAQQMWERNYGGAGDDCGNYVQQTQDGGYIVTGIYNRTQTNSVYLIKTNASGDTLWTRTIRRTGWNEGFSVLETPDTGYLVAGRTYSLVSGHDVGYLIKTNSLGDTLWTKTYDGGQAGWGNSIQPTQDNCYILTGWLYSPTKNDEVWLIKTDSLGNTLWTRAYGGSNHDDAAFVQQTQDSGFVVVGRTLSSGAGAWDVWLIKTDSLGDTLWTRTYGGADNERGACIRQTLDQGYIIVGYTGSFGTGGSDVWLIKTDSLGDTLWTRTYGGTSEDYGSHVLQTTDGCYVIVGTTFSFGAGVCDVWLIKTDSFGDTLWTRTYGGASYDAGYCFQTTSDGGYILTGYTDSFGNYSQVYLIKTDSLGSSSGVEEQTGCKVKAVGSLKANPNPFTSRARIAGHESDRFSLYDISGRFVGIYSGDRIGEGLGAGVYFLSDEGRGSKPVRVVKIK